MKGKYIRIYLIHITFLILCRICAYIHFVVHLEMHNIKLDPWRI